ncbi:MAG: peptidylprolyl isomerase [Pseudohongiellaceae bacterium]
MTDVVTEQAASPASGDMIIADDCVVAFHYRMCEMKNGEKSGWIEESTGREPLLYLHGHANVISGLEAAMTGKKAGDKISITLEPEQAYGPRRSNSFQRVPIKHLHLKPGQKQVQVGEIVAIQTSQGIRNALVVKAGRFNVDVDTNHPYAGRTLHYEIEVASVRAASAEEVAHRHVHGPGGHHH